MWINSDLDREPGVRDHGDGWRCVLACSPRPPRRGAAASTQLPVAFIDRSPARFRRKRWSARSASPIEEGPEQHRRHKHITTSRSSRACMTSVEFTLDADMARPAGRARPHGGGGAYSQGTRRRPPWRASTTTTAARWWRRLLRRRAARREPPSSPTRWWRAAWQRVEGVARSRSTGFLLWRARCASTAPDRVCAPTRSRRRRWPRVAGEAHS